MADEPCECLCHAQEGPCLHGESACIRCKLDPYNYRGLWPRPVAVQARIDGVSRIDLVPAEMRRELLEAASRAADGVEVRPGVSPVEWGSTSEGRAARSLAADGLGTLKARRFTINEAGRAAAARARVSS